MPFTASLLQLSPCLLFFLINACFMVMSLVLLVLVRKVSHYKIRQSENDVITSIFNRAGAIFGIMIAFVVVILWQEYNKTKEDALREGTEALELYRDLSLYPNQKQAAGARQSLSQLARLIIDDEYPAMAEMRLSPATEEMMTQLRIDLHRIVPQNPREQILYNKIIRDFEGLVRLRQSRLFNLESSLPSIVWAVLIAGTFIIMIFAIFLGTEKLWLHMVMTSMLAIILANAFFLILELDYPFMGYLCARPTSYIEMVKVFKAP